MTMRESGPDNRPVASTTPVTGVLISKRRSHDSTGTDVAFELPVDGVAVEVDGERRGGAGRTRGGLKRGERERCRR